MTGAFLYRLLVRQGHEVDIYDKTSSTRCGISPCAWGTSAEFPSLAADAGLDASAYVLSRLDHLWVDDIRLAADLMTVDKQRLIRDLVGGAVIRREEPKAESYDRIIDATGAARGLLPPIDGDLTLSCVQFRIRTGEKAENRISLGGLGYAWCFPLSPGEYHVGCGSFTSDAGARLKALGWLSGPSGPRETVCACSGDIRLSSPGRCLPFVTTRDGCDVWGVGEAIGCVAPLAGDGIVPGMRSVRLLMEWWDDPEGYTEAILREFAWMKRERSVLDSLMRGEAPGVESALVLIGNARRMGIHVGVGDALRLLRRLLRKP
jgi:hypothetical protein